MRSRSRGRVALPVVIRIPFGGGIGAVEHHSESPEVFFAHTAGLRVVACADPADAFAMIQLAIAADDPVIFFEPKRRYWDKAEVDTTAPLSDALPLDKARVVQPGDDVTLLSYGPLVRTCLEAAIAAREDGRSIEVIDLRSLSPLDMDDDHRVGRPHRPLRRRPRGARLRGARRRDRRPGDRAVLLPPGSPRARGSAVSPCRTRPPGSEDHYLPDLDRILDAVDRTFTY